MTKILGKRNNKAYDLKTLLGYLADAEDAHRNWRYESWFDSRFRDGQQWDEKTVLALIAKSINPITINRTFPIINMIVGTFIQNQHDIVASGRTEADGEVSQLMSEAIQFVMQQNGGSKMIADAFLDQVMPGFGCIAVEKNHDPRREIVKLRKYPWYTIGWDPFGGPDMSVEDNRFCYYSDWKDLEAVCSLIPDKAQDLREKFEEITASDYSDQGQFDITEEVEQRVRTLINNSNNWATRGRKRVRPCEMWYTVPVEAWFCVMPNGSVLELNDQLPINHQYEMVSAASQCVKAIVNKVRVATFVADLLLRDVPSPLPHDEYPFVSFLGYTDSYRQPFGVVRQIREQNMEVNKRRTMAVSLISNRRVIMEEGSVEDHDHAYAEVNKQDGLIVLRNGKSETFQIQELGTMAPQQNELLFLAEREMQEITGANNESLGYKTAGSQSNAALETKKEQSNVMTASLMMNVKTSQQKLGERIIAHVQRDWSGPKAMRVTDRVTGAEKFIELNQAVVNNGIITIRNDITQGRYDIVVTDKPMTATVREKNLELIFSSIQQAPQEAIAPLLALAFDLTDLPHKEQMLHQVRMSLGVEPIDPLLTKAEAEAKAMAKQQAMEEAQAADSQMTQAERQAELEKTQAEIQKILAEAEAKQQEAGLDAEKLALDRDKLALDKSKEARESFAQGVEIASAQSPEPKEKEKAK